MVTGPGEKPTFAASCFQGSRGRESCPSPGPRPAGDGLEERENVAQGSQPRQPRISRSRSLSCAPPPDPQRSLFSAQRRGRRRGHQDAGSRLRGRGAGGGETQGQKERRRQRERETHTEGYTGTQSPPNAPRTPLPGWTPAPLSAPLPPPALCPPTAQHPSILASTLLCGCPCPLGGSRLCPLEPCPTSRHPAARPQGQRTGLAFGVVG